MQVGIASLLLIIVGVAAMTAVITYHTVLPYSWAFYGAAVAITGVRPTIRMSLLAWPQSAHTLEGGDWLGYQPTCAGAMRELCLGV